MAPHCIWDSNLFSTVPVAALAPNYSWPVVDIRIMHELPWIMIFWSRVGWFANDFHEWLRHEWKSLANHLTSDQKIVIHGSEFYFLHAIYLEHIVPLQTIVDRLFRHCEAITVDLWRHANMRTGIVTSYSSIVLARANWRKGDLH